MIITTKKTPYRFVEVHLIAAAGVNSFSVQACENDKKINNHTYIMTGIKDALAPQDVAKLPQIIALAKIALDEVFDVDWQRYLTDENHQYKKRNVLD